MAPVPMIPTRIGIIILTAALSLHRYMRTFGLFFLREMRDAVVNQAADALEELDARVAEVVFGGVRPHLLQQRHRRLANEATSMGFGLFHFSSPSSPPSVSYFPASRGWGKGPPSRSAAR